MAHRRTLWWHPKRSDVTFLLGVGIIVSMGIRGRWDAAGVMAAMMLFGIPVATRADELAKNGKPKPEETKKADDGAEDRP